MSNEVKTYLVNDERLNVESQVEMAVKNGPQSSITQKYKQSSNHQIVLLQLCSISTFSQKIL